MTTFLRWKRRYTSNLRGALMLTVYLGVFPNSGGWVSVAALPNGTE